MSDEYQSYIEREKQCQRCVHKDYLHEEGEFHTVCEAGVCVLCFHAGKTKCKSFLPKRGVQP